MTTEKVKTGVPIGVWISIIMIAAGAVASFSVTKYRVDQGDIKMEKACTQWEKDKESLASSIKELTKSVNDQTTETKLLRQEIQFIRNERRR